MALSDVTRLWRHWRAHPPLRILVRGIAAALGVKFPEAPDPAKRYTTAEEFARLVAATGGRIE